MSEWLGIVLFIVVLLVVVMIHESGHFFSAKAFGIKVEEFFVGFGPRLWSVRRGETEYGVKALPFGGYVRIAGMNPFQEVRPQDRDRTYGAKPMWQRAAVILAGPVTHFVLTFLTLALFFMVVGVASPSRPMIEEVAPTLGGRPSPAAQARLEPGDEIVAVDGRRVRSLEDFTRYTRTHVGEEFALTVRRDGEEVKVRVAPVLAEVERQRVGRIGILLGTVRERVGPVPAAARAGTATYDLTKAVLGRLGDIFGPSGLRRIGELLIGGEPRTAEDPASIVGGARLGGQALEAGAWDRLVELFVVFNAFIGILNLIPLPPLDGGHLAVLAVEKARGRRIDPRSLVPFTAVVTAFLILFVLSLVYLDIVNPLPNPFR